jgi:hypothetical protein
VKTLAKRIHHFVLQRMNQTYIQRVCGMFLVVFLLGLAASFLTQVNGQTIFGPPLGADYAQYYVVGRIYNEYAPELVYDRPLEAALYQQVTHDPDPANGIPYVAAPFFILPFILLSRLPYTWSFALWMLIAAALYVSGMRLAWKSTRHLPADAWKTALLVGILRPSPAGVGSPRQVTAVAVFGWRWRFPEFAATILGGSGVVRLPRRPSCCSSFQCCFTRRWRMLAVSPSGIRLAGVSVLR